MENKHKSEIRGDYMCEYCKNRALNKIINDIDDNNENIMSIFFLNDGNGKRKAYLRVELDAIDNDGYKARDFFNINYCPMCRKKIGGLIKWKINKGVQTVENIHFVKIYKIQVKKIIVKNGEKEILRRISYEISCRR